MNINVEVDLHSAFTAATAAQGVDMTTVRVTPRKTILSVGF